MLGLDQIDQTMASLAGGKGANLGELRRIGAIAVPDGCCVTTEAFGAIMASTPQADELLDRLAGLDPDDQAAIRAVSARLRSAVESAVVPDQIATVIADAVSRLGRDGRYAVRSSATAEDLPTASFAGQQDTYLNVPGAEVLTHVTRCMASLFTERAVGYRLRRGFGRRTVAMAVVVQRRVAAEAAGVMFTADPVSSNRRVVAIEASPGLGEALVSGLVNPDRYQVRDGAVVAATDGAGTLTDAQVIRLAGLGRRIEAQFGRPQDVEWCLADGAFQFVQSRPITTLFPVPTAADGGNHVYVSVGHQQMMTDAMKPLGLSVWQLTAKRPMVVAGGRLFVDVTAMLAAPASRTALMAALGKSDPLIADALATVVDRRDFIETQPDGERPEMPVGTEPAAIGSDPAIVAELIEQARASLVALRRDIEGKSGAALVDFILADFEELRRVLFDPRGLQVILAGMQAGWKLSARLEKLLGEKNAVDALTQSVPDNVTSEMGLALLDVADVIRPHPDVIAFLDGVAADDVGFLDALPALPGGDTVRDAIAGFLEIYGMRCVGEIDITRPRWSERPAALLPILLGNVRNFGPGAAAERFSRGLLTAREKEREVLSRLRALPDGEQQAEAAKKLIDQLRTFSGYREYPKYGMIGRYFVYKQALLAEADRQVRAGVLRDREDIYYLSLPEFGDVVRTGQADHERIGRRQDAFASYRALTPPRVLTSDGEALTGTYRRDGIPAGALTGLAVSAGTVEGRARVVLDLAEADLVAGDILVTAYTDPSWTPAFVAVSGLVTEVGGLMTHGAVIAREYGLPAVVGIENATRLIIDGQRIRLNGSGGYVEILG